MARECLDAGWVLSLSGTVSSSNATALAQRPPDSSPGQLLVETGMPPFLTPCSGGAPNETVNYLGSIPVRALADLLTGPPSNSRGNGRDGPAASTALD